MKSDKRKKLEASGWRVGSAADFLGLSPEESRLVELKLVLAKLIKEQRQLAKLSQSALANLLNSSQSRIAKVESADESVSLELYFRSIFALDASIDDVRFEVEPRVRKTTKKALTAGTTLKVARTGAASKKAGAILKPRKKKPKAATK